MNEANISQMNHLKECGGYENVNFIIENMHNQVTKQRRQLPNDLNYAMAYLETLAARDQNLFYNVEQGRERENHICVVTKITSHSNEGKDTDFRKYFLMHIIGYVLGT
ncbi:hypothetical protein Ahy_B03g064260 [Arachis hypogaea]|uniref:Uncharacterized protein n=1 Tax=Arachis hypogaea TaxID=3818 RepID=A0A444ZZ84_ARAHY|nr:hypothetical protein Ahy_B03g064260 [Arachis hypogaea]